MSIEKEKEIEELKEKNENLENQLKNVDSNEKSSRSNEVNNNYLDNDDINKVKEELDSTKEKLKDSIYKYDSLHEKYSILIDESRKNKSISNDINDNEFHEEFTSDSHYSCGFGIEKLNESLIINADKFHSIMNCCFKNYPNSRVSTLIMCSNFHEFCKDCLKHYYSLKLDQGKFNNKNICPICKDNSGVENQNETLKLVLGSDYNNYNY